MITRGDFEVVCVAAGFSEQKLVNVEYKGGRQDSFWIAEIGTATETGFQVQDGLGTFVCFNNITKTWAA